MITRGELALCRDADGASTFRGMNLSGTMTLVGRTSGEC